MCADLHAAKVVLSQLNSQKGQEFLMCSGVAIHRKFTDYTHSKRMLVETRITFTVPSVSILNPGLE